MDAAGYELRLRMITTGTATRTVLTYKEPAVEESASKAEHETTAADPAVLDTVLRGLGLAELVSFRKHCDNYRFTADGREMLATVVRIAELAGQTFLELETTADSADLPDALARLRAVLAELGVSEGELTTTSYTDRVAAHRARSPGPFTAPPAAPG